MKELQKLNLLRIYDMITTQIPDCSKTCKNCKLEPFFDSNQAKNHHDMFGLGNNQVLVAWIGYLGGFEPGPEFLFRSQPGLMLRYPVPLQTLKLY